MDILRIYLLFPGLIYRSKELEFSKSWFSMYSECVVGFIKWWIYYRYFKVITIIVDWFGKIDSLIVDLRLKVVSHLWNFFVLPCYKNNWGKSYPIYLICISTALTGFSTQSLDFSNKNHVFDVLDGKWADKK